MAVVRTSFQDVAAFQDALDSGGAAGTLMDGAIDAAHTSFSDFGSATLLIEGTPTPNNASGSVLNGGTFSVSGSNLHLAAKTITQFYYDDNSPAAYLEMTGNMGTTGSAPNVINAVTGSISYIGYSGGPMGFSFNGSIATNNLMFGNAVYSATLFNILTPQVSVTFSGTIGANNGVYSGSISRYNFVDLGDAEFDATALPDVAFSILQGNDAGQILAAMLAGNDRITGTGTAQVLDGYGGNDTIVAGSGGDTLFGRAGNDSLNGGGGHDTLSGGNGNDTLNGGGGNDRLDGGAGNDRMVGVAGNDLYIVNSALDAVVETSNQGTDTVQSSITYTLLNHVENLTLTGTANRNGTGNNLANTLTGNNGRNALDGVGGNDTLTGSGGNDTLIGGGGSDSLNGGADNDGLNGDSGNDTLVGGGGNDTLNGGTGSDSLTGGGGNDSLNGGSGNDFLDGGTGGDTMLGGTGDDTYVSDSATDVIGELADQGVDTLLSSVTRTLGEHLEHLTLTGNGNIDGTGNDLVNGITGNDGANVLDGAGGADSLLGGGGNDTLIWDAADALVDGGAGEADVLRVLDATLDLAGLAGTTIVDIEQIDLADAGAQTLTLTLDDVLTMSSTDVLTVDGDSADAVTVADGEWTDGGVVDSYHLYTLGAATLRIHADITDVTIAT